MNTLTTDDFQTIASFLQINDHDFATYLDSLDIEGETEAYVIIEALFNYGKKADLERLCPHDEMHDRIRRALGYVRDKEDNDRSVCALCWIETAQAGSNRFHSPHGGLLVTAWTIMGLQ